MRFLYKNYRRARFTLLKLWYRASGYGPVRAVEAFLSRHRRGTLRMAGVTAIVAVAGLSFFLMSLQARAQTATLSSDDLLSGTMNFGTIGLTANATQLSLQQGSVGSWDQSTIDGTQPVGNFVRGISSLTYGPNNMLYYLGNAGGQCYFKSYDTELQQWNILRDVPVGCGGGSLIKSDGARYIYYMPGNSTTSFYRYDISTGNWKELADIPAQVANYSDAVYATQNTNGYVYLFRGGGSPSLFRYDVNANTWGSMAPFPTSQNVNNGIEAAWDKGDYIYAGNNQVGEFKKYSISTNTWSNVGSISLQGTMRFSLTFVNGTIIASKLRLDGGYERSYTQQFNLSTNVWTDLPQAPSGGTEYDYPPASVYDGSRYLYVQLGTEQYKDLYRYDTVAKTWNTATLFNNGFDDSDWHQYPVFDGNQTLYYTGGNSQSSTGRVYKYDVPSKAVTQIGSQITTQSGWRGVYKSGAVYYLPWSGNNTFQKYDTSSNQWVPLANFPANTNWGLDIVDGGDGYLYATPGCSQGFYRYNISSDTWQTLSSVPQSICNGGGLTRVGTTIYALIGNGTGYFYRYNMSTNVWTSVANNIPSGKIDHGAFITGDGSRYVYIGASTRTNEISKHLYRFDTTNDTWARMADLPSATNVGTSAVYDTNANKLYVFQSGYSGRIWTWSPGTNPYVGTGTWYSKTMSFTQVQSWTSLTATVAGGGSSTIYTRTSSDGNLWTDWQAVTGTTINSPTNKFLQMKVTLSGSGSVTPTVSNISVQYTQETSPPTVPSQFTALDSKGGSKQLTSGVTYEYEHPYFSWSGADDGANGAGVAGYYVYFGTDSNADPVTDGSYTTDTGYVTTAPMTAGDVYYVRIKVKDALGNVSAAATYFSYRYFYISPPGSQVVTSDADFNAGINVKANIANGDMKLRQTATGAWSVGATDMLPNTTYGSSEVVINDYLYVMRGASSTTMWRYDLSNKIWQTMANAPGNFSAGSSITYDGSRYIYAVAGNNTNAFYRYDTVNDAWTTLPVLPLNAQTGTDITWIGNGKIVIMFTGSREFGIFDTTSNTYTTKTSYPSSISYGGSGIWYDGNDTIYANLGADSMWNFDNNSRVVFAKYSISNDFWRTLSAPPVSTSYSQHNLVSDGHGGLYSFVTDQMYNIGHEQMAERYDIASDSWSDVPGLNSQVYYGSAVSDNNRYLYILPSENNTTRKMLRYDTWNNVFTPTTKSADKWERSTWDMPSNAWTWQLGNASTAAYDGSKWMYIIGGDEGNFSRFVKYNPRTGETIYLPPPTSVNIGGSLSYLNGQLYYLRSGSSKDFFRFDQTTGMWSRMADIPATSYRPGPSTLQVVGSVMYAFVGNNNGFYKYTPNSGTGTWTQMTNAPGTMLNGSAVYDSTNGYIYALGGNGSNVFWRYSIAGNSWSTMAALPAGTSYGSAMTIKDGQIYAAYGNTTTNTYVYSIAGNSWTTGSPSPDTFRYGSMFMPISDTFSMALVGDDSPDFWRFNYPSATTAYEGTATHISQPMVIAGIYDYANITAQVNIPAQTGIELFTRTSDNGSDWNDWTITTDVKYYSGQMTAKVASVPKKYTQVKAVLTSFNNLSTPTLSSYALNYYYDVDPPSNPTVMTATKSASSTDELTSNIWYNYPNPKFDWPEPGQPGGATDGPLGSHIAGYWVYVGTDPTAMPRTAGIFVADSSYTPNLITSGSYYVRIQAQDITGNVDGNVYSPFIYKFDNTPPTTPNLITVTPGGYTTQNKYTFDWPAAFDADSGISGYCYHTGATSGPFAAETCQSGRNLTNISAAYRTGTNVLYLRTIDTAGNYSSGYTTVSYYYSTDPPSPPTNVRAIPPTSTANLFAFAWDLPSLYSGDPNQLQYCYSINELPSQINSTCTSDRFISPFKAATRQGTNILYMVAKDEAGNVNWNNYTSANFIANTVSPGIPLNPVITDTSDRVSQRWSLTLTWDKPTFEGNGITGYIIERSPDGHSFTEIGKTTTVAFVDLDVQPGTTYYYRVRAADNVDNRGGPSGSVAGSPRGSFTSPPNVVVQPQADASFNQASIHWVTSRDSTSFVYYGTNPSSLTQSKGSLTATSDHTVLIDGLNPSATYYYRVQSFDNDRTYDLASATSQIFYFRTTEAARIFAVSSDNVTLTTANLNWQTSVPTKTKIDYGTSTAYGLTATDDDGNFSSNHLFRLTGLSSGTTYHYRITATTEFGSTVTSDDYTLKTIARPTVSNIRFSPIENEPTTGVTVTWTTNVPTSSTVRYSGAGDTQEVSTSELVTEHSTTLRNLASSTAYTFNIEGRDGYGNLTASEDQRWQSGYDTRAPSISSTSLSMTTTDGANNTRAQLIVSWKTDEPSTSQVMYGKSSTGKMDKSTPLDTEPTTNHVVVISNLDLASIYKVQIQSKDISGNSAYGSSTLVVTPDKEVSVLDSVITLMQRLFRF